MPSAITNLNHNIPQGNTTPRPTTHTAATAEQLLTTDKNQSVKVEDFLNLMIAQLQNQDIMNPMDDTQYVTQLAQFQTLSQMQELAYNSKAEFMMGLVGKEVTAASISKTGNIVRATGPVTKVSLVDGKFEVYIGGDDKPYTYEQIMEIKPAKDATAKIAEIVDKIAKELEALNKPNPDGKPDETPEEKPEDKPVEKPEETPSEKPESETK